MVHADAYGRVVLLADINKRYKALLDLPQFVGILLIGVLQMLEHSCRVDVVSWVDAHLFTVLGCNVGHMGVEVNVGHKWSHVAVSF